MLLSFLTKLIKKISSNNHNKRLFSTQIEYTLWSQKTHKIVYLVGVTDKDIQLKHTSLTEPSSNKHKNEN